MALPWLDAARYADSNGFQQDGDTWQWIWRDWLVQALNQDLPFDQLTIWQLAGDLLPNSTTEQKIASAFNRNHLLNGEGGAIAEEQRWVNLFDRINTTATTWLGLTMACAQCHDHKYDPITQRDYYSLLDAFNRVPERGTPKRFSTRIRVDTPFLELPTEENKQRLAALDAQIRTTQAQAESARQQAFETWTATLARESDAFRSLPEEARNLLDLKEPERTNEEQQRLQQLLRDHFDEQHQERLNDLPAVKELQAIRAQRDAYQKDQIPRLMIMSDDRPRETHILSRGEYLKPTERVSFAPPAFLPPLSPDAPQNRLGLARWLVDDHHPLTSRVQVNRMWQHFFGQGIVKTAEDFGVQSEYPIHQDLLDWLAVEFRESGWSIKHMHRLIVTSATYQQSSKVTAAHRKWDPENRLYARASRFRMPAMILRDWALAAAGLLDRTRGGAPVYPYQPDNVWEALAITKERDFTYPTSSGRDLFRRSLYTFWRRTVRPANMFDSSNRQACRVRSGTTSTPLHALTTMNDPTWVEAARMLAEQSLQHASSLDQQLHHAFQRVLCRAPDAQEQALLKGAYQRQWALYQADGKAARQLLAVGESDRNPNLAPPQHAALTAVCLGILNLERVLNKRVKRDFYRDPEHRACHAPPDVWQDGQWHRHGGLGIAPATRQHRRRRLVSRLGKSASSHGTRQACSHALARRWPVSC